MISKRVHQVLVGIAVAIGSSIVSAVAVGDWPPLAGIARVESLKQHQIHDEIMTIWFQEYCPANEKHNSIALAAAVREIADLELEYESGNGGLAIPVLPCP